MKRGQVNEAFVSPRITWTGGDLTLSVIGRGLLPLSSPEHHRIQPFLHLPSTLSPSSSPEFYGIGGHVRSTVKNVNGSKAVIPPAALFSTFWRSSRQRFQRSL